MSQQKNDEAKKFPKLMKVEDVAEMFQISKSSVYRMIDSGMLTYYKISGRLRFDEADLLAYLEKVKHKPWNEKFYLD